MFTFNVYVYVYVDVFCQSEHNLMDLRFVVLCLLGFAGFFRVEEVLNIKLRQLFFFPDHLKIVLQKSKTDQHRKGNEVFIAATNTAYCSVNYVKMFLEATKLDKKSYPEAFLIPRLYKTKRGHSVSRTLGISYTTVYDNLRPK